MSGPTKGMVAGQPIKTGAQTEAFDEGYARTFGEPKRQRGRFRFDAQLGECVPVEADWVDPSIPGRLLTSEEEIHGKSVTSGGEDISSRRRRREYMQRNGLTDAGDYSKGYIEKIQRQKDDAISGTSASRQLKAEMGRALYELKQKKPRR